MANPNLRWNGQSWYRWTGSEWVRDESIPAPAAEPGHPSGETAPVDSLQSSTEQTADRRGKIALVAVGVGAVVAIAAAGAALVLTRGGGETATVNPPDSMSASVMPEEGDEVVLVGAADTSDGFLVQSAAGTLPTVAEAEKGIQDANGDTAGLYGGQLGSAQCNTEALIEGITDSGFRQQWVDMTGQSVKAFLEGKTGVVLLHDTYVARDLPSPDGEWLTQDAVLQAGTPVMVDDTGVPVVSCSTGTPLSQPTSDFTPARVDRTADWYRKSRVTNVSPGNPLARLVLFDPEDDILFSRPTGTQGEQDVQVTDTATPTPTQTASAPETTPTGTPESDDVDDDDDQDLLDPQ